MNYRLRNRLIVLVICALACAPKPRPSMRRLYEGLEEPLKALDFTALRDKSIVIDPGHGGVFRGARGIGGLDEADVNLGVALYLWGFLEEAGAEVRLTRTTDKDFVNGDSLRLRDDLQARVAIVNSIRPDIFMCLHHNADFHRDTTVNEIQIYHKMSDRGPSLDLARIITRHLLRNLGETRSRVIPGNYYVLRNSAVTSILCEPSYISNPQVESKLKLADKQRLEAEAYFIGLVDYFSRGIPSIVGIEPTGIVSHAMPRIDVVFADNSPVELSSVRISIDGAGLKPFKLGPNRFSAIPQSPLPSGTHTVHASGRTITGNSSSEAVHEFRIDLAPAIMRLAANPPGGRPPYPQKISALLLDRHGNAVADSTEAVFVWKSDSLRRATLSGSAALYSGIDVPFGQPEVTVRCGDLDQTIRLSVSEDKPYISGFVVDIDDKPIKDVTVVSAPSRSSRLTDSDGYFLIEGERSTALEASKPGYKKTFLKQAEDSYPMIRLERFYRQLDPALTVAIDADKGGDMTGWVGPTGITASSLNLEVARRAAHLLSSAGLNAILTREADNKVSREERVRRCEVHPSALVVSISHAEGRRSEAMIRHYPRSSGGSRLARDLGRQMESLLGYRTEIDLTAEYLIQQTSCPAVKVTFTTSGTVDDEAALAETDQICRKANALFCGIIRYLGIPEESTFSIEGRVTRAGRPDNNATILIDGAFEIGVTSDGEFEFNLLERGAHTLEAFSGARLSGTICFDDTAEFLEIRLD